MSFFSTVVPVIMRQEHYSLEAIGLLQLVKLPWIAKFLWAPLVDRTSPGTRQLRRWIVLSELFYAVVIVGIGVLDLQTDFRLIVFLMVIAFTASATQDIATDAFAILVLNKNERSLGNSMQSAGSFTGTLLGTGVLLIAYHYFGWTTLLLLLAAFVVFALLPLQLYRKNTIARNELLQKVTLRAFTGFFRIPGMGRRTLMLATYYAGIIGILAMLKPYLVDLGYSVKEIGIMSGITGTAVAAGSALIAGIILRKLGRNRSLVLFLLLEIGAALYFWWISRDIPSLTTIYAGICFLWGAYGMATVAIFTTSMDAVRKGYEGTDFTLQIVITHLSGILIAVLSGKAGDALGYRGLFAAEVMIGGAALLVLFWNLAKKPKS